MIVVINFGSQVAHLIARRVRELGVFSEIVPHDISARELKSMKPQAIILSGGPESVNHKHAPHLDPKIFELNMPILGICYGHQLIAQHFHGEVSNSGLKEYGKTTLRVVKAGSLLRGFRKSEQVWMSHGDSVMKAPKGFQTLATTASCPVAAFAHPRKKVYAVQFHPEVSHTKKGMWVLENFLFNVCKVKKDYDLGKMQKELVTEIKQTVDEQHVLFGISGGVDSTVAAVLFNKAIGKRLHCVFVNHGLLRLHEAAEVKQAFKQLKLNVQIVDASRLFLRRLRGVTDPEKKRRIIGHTFVEVFEKEAKKLKREHRVKFLGQGTIYPDRIESAQPSKNADKIKSHHNVALPKKMGLQVIEPLRDLYKDGVRELGKELKVPKKLLDRHPFPGPGIAIRIAGAITPLRIRIARHADAIYQEELHESGWYAKTWQAFAALLPVKAVGVKGDARVYDYVIALRAVTSKDAMTADWARLPFAVIERISSRILNEVSGVARVVYDVSQKPPATIEYE